MTSERRKDWARDNVGGHKHNTFPKKLSKAHVNNQLNQKPAKRLTPNKQCTQLSEIQGKIVKTPYLQGSQLGSENWRSQAKQQAGDEPRIVGKCHSTRPVMPQKSMTYVYTICFYYHLVFRPLIGEAFYSHLKHTIITVNSFLISLMNYSNVLSI